MLIAVLGCALAGCWEEIHYSPPPTSSTTDATPPAEAPVAQVEDPAQNFADDVANKLSDTPTAPSETATAVGEPAQSLSTTTPTLPPPEESPAESPPIPAQTTNQFRSPRRMAWLLGSNLSLAALANDRAASEDKVADWFDKSRRLADLMNTTVADLPPRPAAGESDATATRAMDYLFEQGQSVGRHLATQYGDDHAALFELALKSNILLVRYHPEAPVVKALSAAISQAGERAKLPPEQYQPLLKLLDENAPVKDVRNAVFDMHANVDRHLSTDDTAAQP